MLHTAYSRIFDLTGLLVHFAVFLPKGRALFRPCIKMDTLLFIIWVDIPAHSKILILALSLSAVLAIISVNLIQCSANLHMIRGWWTIRKVQMPSLAAPRGIITRRNIMGTHCGRCIVHYDSCIMVSLFPLFLGTTRGCCTHNVPFKIE